MGTIQFRPATLGTRTADLAREITPSIARDFLIEAANLRSGAKASNRFLRKFPAWLAPLFPLTATNRTPEGGSARSLTSPLSVGAALSNPVYMLGELLRQAWRQPTSIERQIGVLRLEHDILSLESDTRQESPETSAIALRILLLHAIGMADRMSVCGNPQCPAPHFIAARDTQKFCGESCAAPSQKAYKLKWWKEHGKEWARKRKKSRAKKQPVPTKRATPRASRYKTGTT